jgi:hypothetical protein
LVLKYVYYLATLIETCLHKAAENIIAQKIGTQMPIFHNQGCQICLDPNIPKWENIPNGNKLYVSEKYI